MTCISVIIPLYNAESTIQQTVESVLQQTWTDFELIIVDDGSTDASLERLQSIKDERIRVLSYPNAGAAIARNRGLQASTGDCVAFLDADDLWSPDKLEAQFNALNDHPEAAVAHSWTQFIDESGTVLSAGGRPRVKHNDAYRRLLIHNFLDSGSNPLIRRHALIDIGGFDESLSSSQDWDLYLRLAARYPFVTVPHYQIFYRMCSGSISSNIQRQERDALAFIERSYASAPDSLQHLRQATLAHLYRYLTLRGLEGRPSRSESWFTARCFWKALYYNPSLLRHQTQFVGALAVKLVVALTVPPGQRSGLTRMSSTLRKR